MKKYEEKEVKWLIGKPRGLFFTIEYGGYRNCAKCFYSTNHY